METSIFVVHVEPVLASRIFVHAKRLGMASQGYAWIVTSKSMNHLHNLKDRSSMQGFIGFRSYKMKESKEFDMLQLMNFITQMVNFEIVNVLGTEGERRVGFWTGKFTNKLSHGFAYGRHLFLSSGFETIIWPGGTSTIPKGRRMQTSTKTLRIAVPKSNGFPQLLKVDIDLQTNITFSGFCIEVFKAAMAGLEHQVPYEFVPFEYNKTHIGEAYSDLVYQVYLQIIVRGFYFAVYGHGDRDGFSANPKGEPKLVDFLETTHTRSLAYNCGSLCLISFSYLAD
ncbi:hypothetical protein Gotur_000790 [Gossypium turneri]